MEPEAGKRRMKSRHRSPSLAQQGAATTAHAHPYPSSMMQQKTDRNFIRSESKNAVCFAIFIFKRF
jgi:hypothetical protein